MREILFRGKTKHGGEWVYGGVCCSAGNTIIVSFSERILTTIEGKRVLPETVGQYTGLTDKNGKKIFEGDIVKAQDDIYGSVYCDGIVGAVIFDETAFFIETPNVIDTVYLFNECAVYEVIGNIHDNPELLEGGEE